jgi:hypothetical protein
MNVPYFAEQFDLLRLDIVGLRRKKFWGRLWDGECLVQQNGPRLFVIVSTRTHK